jgi:hypothetical protein
LVPEPTAKACISVVAKYTFFTQAARDESNIAATSEELVNVYPEQAPGDARTRVSLRSVLGEVAFADLGQPLVRAAEAAAGSFWAVAAGNLYEVKADGSVLNRGAVGNSDATSISGNGANVCVVANGDYSVWDGASLTNPAAGAFSDFGSVTFSDFDTILTELNGRKWCWSDLADPTTLPALNFATAEARDGDILRGTVDRSQVFLMTEKCIEVWRSTGASGATRYTRLTVIDAGRGLKAYHLLARDAFGIFFVGNDNVAYVLSGSGITPVSTPAVQSDIESGDPVSCFYYEDRGHKFCVIRFSDRPSWVYDFTTQLWHRRQSGVERAPWGLQRMALAHGKWLGADGFGAVVEMRRTNTDRGLPLKRIMRGKPIYMAGKKFSVREFQPLCSVGNSNLGRDAEIMLRWSRDGGVTWEGPRTESIGGLGEYETTVEFYALGRGEQFVPEVSCADATDVVFYSDAVMELT